MIRKDSLQRLHQRLTKRRDALRLALSGDMTSLREVAAEEFVGDTVDAAVDAANEEVNMQLVEIESRELEQIEHALNMMTRGVYGRCEFCGGKIAVDRLNALPYTNSCIDCARENERRGSWGMMRPSPQSGARWAKVRDTNTESRVNLSDFEVDYSDSGR
jgi:DnaK suppressor protein